MNEKDLTEKCKGKYSRTIDDAVTCTKEGLVTGCIYHTREGKCFYKKEYALPNDL